MDYLTNPWWENLPHSSKYDIFLEHHHHLVIQCLLDKTTHLEAHPDGTYTLYGNEEAVLVIPERITTQLLLWWCAWLETKVAQGID